MNIGSEGGYIKKLQDTEGGPLNKESLLPVCPWLDFFYDWDKLPRTRVTGVTQPYGLAGAEAYLASPV